MSRHPELDDINASLTILTWGFRQAMLYNAQRGTSLLKSQFKIGT